MRRISLLLLFLVLLMYWIKAQWLDGALYPDFRVNDDSTIWTQEYSSIGVDSSGNFVITWNDSRNYPNNQSGQVYCQRYNNLAVKQGVNFRIGQDTAGGAIIHVLKDGRFIVMWGNQYDIYQQRFNKNGVPLGVYNKINDTTVSFGRYTGGIGADSIGNYVIVWTDYRYGTLRPNIYGQRYDSAGNKIGTNFRINDDSPQNSHSSPSVAVNRDGSFVVCWADGRIGARVFLQRYDKYGNTIGVNQRVDEDPTYGSGSPNISCDGNGYIVIAFDDSKYLPNVSNIFFQLYDTSGNKVGTNQRVDEGLGSDRGFTRTSMQSNGKFFITWDEYFGTSGKPYGQRYNKVGSKIGSNFYVPTGTNFSDGGGGEPVLWNDRIYSSWEDNRNGNYDIFCNIRSFINPDSTLSGIESKHKNSYEFKLFSAFPNPLNPATNINYQLPISNFVKISVFDMLGKEVEILASGKQNKGFYKVIWDGSGYSSGIYFVTMITESGFRASQKLILLR